ncbi:MAG: DUF4331 domain-containing protein [Actinomycetia bacterium]|nr:DUF4331 domain-containing protein [Actinomycetes bacterium]MCH9700893.1 DUF4331 domain-containing protein [Actinomycetes bacterium]MCH9760845.1 DUF4331 domain-containing protein [Actinomycetes bacterium]
MSTHVPGLGAPLGDPRLSLRDLYVFQSPADPGRTAVILTVDPDAGALHPDAVYRLGIDYTGDYRNDIAFSFVYSPPLDGAQTVDVYLAVGAQASTVAAVGSLIFGGVAVSLGAEPTVVESGGFTFAAGVRSDPSHADADVMAMIIELPNGYLSASPDVRIWGRCSLLSDGEWVHVDRVGHPSLGSDIATGDALTEYRAGEPNRDRERWMGPLIEVMARAGGYSREAAIAAIEAESTLPDVLTYNPSRAAEYPNGRTLSDDVVGHRRAFLTGRQKEPSGSNPPPGVHPEFPYLAPPG